MSLKSRIIEAIQQKEPSPVRHRRGNWYEHEGMYYLLAVVSASPFIRMVLVGLDGNRFTQEPIEVSDPKKLTSNEWKQVGGSAFSQMRYIGNTSDED